MRKVKCLVRGGCQFGGWNQVTTLSGLSVRFKDHNDRFTYSFIYFNQGDPYP